MPTSNSFEEFEEVFDDINDNARMKKIIKSLSIFVTRIQITYAVDEIAVGNYEIKIINNKHVKIQSKSSITYVNIVKELKNRDIEFQTYKPKKGASKSSLNTCILH
jgi:hypothetical protein